MADNYQKRLLNLVKQPLVVLVFGVSAALYRRPLRVEIARYKKGQAAF